MHTEFWWRNLRERDHLEEPCLDGRIIIIWFFKKWDGSMDWIDLARDRNRWRVPVDAVISLRFPQNAGNFLSS